MGCYGIGVTRIAAAVIEQSHDENGIIWPISIAPFEVYLLATNMKNDKVKEIAEKLYSELSDRGVEVLLRRRDERAGFKFKDADLVGIPIRVTVGEKRAKNDTVEVKLRSCGDVEVVKVDEAVNRVLEFREELYRALQP